MEKLTQFRKDIDELDQIIVTSLAKRIGICREVAVYKSKENIPMMQTERVIAVKKNRRVLAEKLGINPDYIEEIYNCIINESCRVEDEIIDSLKDSKK